MKQIEYKQSLARTCFWRTKQQQEVDFVEENSGKIIGYEFKWSKKKTTRLPKTFVESYNAESNIIDTDNFRQFVIMRAPKNQCNIRKSVDKNEINCYKPHIIIPPLGF